MVKVGKCPNCDGILVEEDEDSSFCDNCGTGFFGWMNPLGPEYKEFIKVLER